MDLFEQLPPLTSLTLKDIPPQVLHQLGYLWKAAHLTAINSNSLSHNFCLEFAVVAKKHDIVLPDEVKYKFCSYCQVLFLPTVTCRSRIARSKSKQRSGVQYKNYVVGNLILDEIILVL